MRISDWSSDVCSSDLYYILDLSPEKSFIRWAVEQGLTVFVVSWKSADESMKDVVWDDYIIHGQVDAIDTVRDLLKVPDVHTVGYCVRSEERRVGKECVSTCRSRWWQYN